jgi:hypothetical protein
VQPRLVTVSASKLMPGETSDVLLESVYCYDTLANGVASGFMHVTNYKLVFAGNYVTV